MVEKEVFLTLDGLKKLEDELDHSKTVKRKEIAGIIKEALDFGDISENSEYDQAKNEQAQLEDRIAKLEGMLRNARIIDENDIKTDVVSVGCKVLVKDLNYDEEVKLTIKGSVEADPHNGIISNESPVGSALLGHKVGDIIDISVPDGVIKYEILNITR